MDMEPVFNEYKTYTHQYFSETVDQHPQDMKKPEKQAFGNNTHHHSTMKTIAKAYLRNRQSSVQETVYHILPEFSGCVFININLSEEKVQVLLSQKKLRGLPEDSPNIFKKLNIDRYIQRASATFSNGQCCVKVDFC